MVVSHDEVQTSRKDSCKTMKMTLGPKLDEKQYGGS